MDQPTIKWALFCAVLIPIILRSPDWPLMMTAVHIAAAIGAVFVSDIIERHSRRL